VRALIDAALTRAMSAGAEVKVTALAALRATREAEARRGRERLPCIVGIPLPGERLAGKVFDGRTEAAIFPGDLPSDARDLIPPARETLGFVAFRPPRVRLDGPEGEGAPLPHVRLDRAIEFLLGDWLQ
jgi:predicted YcjX-like family ATPase